MSVRRSMRFLLALFVVCSVGCSGGPTFVPVSGRVTLNEKPLPDAYVIFQPTVGEPNEVSQGKTDTDGNFALVGIKGQAGAKLGDHTVTITTVSPDAMDDERSPLPRDRVPQEYRDSPLQFTVMEDANEAIFDLSDRR